MKRFWVGFGWGVTATVVMSALMILGVLTGMSPMPKPIPAAIVGQLTGGALPKPALMAVAAILHLTFGGFWGGALARYSRRVTVGQGLLLGTALWAFMGVAVLPWLSWGLFGSAQTPKIAVATLVLHLLYGLTLGWTLGSKHAESAPGGIEVTRRE